MPRNLRNVRKYEDKTDKRAIIFPYWIYMWRSDSRTNYSDGGFMRPQESIDYSDMSHEEAVQSMYGKTYDRNPPGLKEGLRDIGMMAATPILMFGAPFKALQLGRLALGSRAYKAFSFVKRPVLTMAVNANVRGAKAAMSVSKAYGRTIAVLGALDFKRNVELIRQREWKRLGINLYGPPGSLWYYDNHMSDNSETAKAKRDAVAAKSRVGGSLPSKPKTRGKLKSSTKKFLPGTTPYAYKPKSDERCRKGYKSELIMGRRMCVKID